jgi:hypothetical protein
MLAQKQRVIHERGIQIPINRKDPTQILHNLETINYDLNQHIFDPSKSSPPNDFMIKLKKRMEMFESLQINVVKSN